MEEAVRYLSWIKVWQRADIMVTTRCQNLYVSEAAFPGIIFPGKLSALRASTIISQCAPAEKPQNTLGYRKQAMSRHSQNTWDGKWSNSPGDKSSDFDVFMDFTLINFVSGYKISFVH